MRFPAVPAAVAVLAEHGLAILRHEAVTQSAVERAVDALDPDTLSPRQALEQLYQLKAMRGDNK